MRACWLKWVGRDWSISADYIWLNYSDANTAFAYAQKRDPKVEQLLMISNMYRSLAGAGVLLVIILLASLLPASLRLPAALCSFIALFVASWIKQERYVEKRINFNLEERDDHERD